MINISFISQEQTLFEGQAEMVVMDGKEGQLGIVKGHSPLLAKGSGLLLSQVVPLFRPLPPFRPGLQRGFVLEK